MNGIGAVTRKLNDCSQNLTSWNKEGFGHALTSIVNKKTELVSRLDSCNVYNNLKAILQLEILLISLKNRRRHFGNRDLETYG